MAEAVGADRVNDAGEGRGPVPESVRSTREEIILAGERLFAQHGLDGVSLRQVSAAAGNANNSAVHYHFGSKEQLIQAIFDYRLRRLTARWDLLIAETRPQDLTAWVDCHVRSLMEESELEGGYHVSFVAMLLQYRRLDVLARVPASYAETHRRYVDRLHELLVDVAEPLRSFRVQQAMKLTTYSVAGREHTRAAGGTLRPFAFDLANLVDGIVGFLSAPVSDRALASAQGLDVDALMWAVD